MLGAVALGACPDDATGCVVDGDCGAGAFCVEGRCQHPCNVNKDCPARERCVNGFCRVLSAPGDAGAPDQVADGQAGDASAPADRRGDDAWQDSSRPDALSPDRSPVDTRGELARGDSASSDATRDAGVGRDTAAGDAAGPDIAQPDSGGASDSAVPPDAEAGITCNGGAAPCDQGCCPWHVEIVDQQGIAGLHTSIALDQAGRPHISYAEKQTRELRYARRNDLGVWGAETVDNRAVGWDTSIALDEEYEVHISHYALPPADTMLFTRGTSGNWNTSIVDNDGIVGRWGTSLALDDLDRPHVSYCNTDTGALRYAFELAAEAWNIQTVAVGGSVGRDSSLLLEPGTQTPLIAYLDVLAGKVMLARPVGATWDTVEVAAAVPNAVAGTSLALSSDGIALVSFVDNAQLKLVDLHAALHVAVVDDSGDVGADTALVLDSRDRPWIAYAAAGQLKLARRGDQGWRIDVVDAETSSLSTGLFADLALDAADRPFISYHDEALGALKCAHW